MKLKNVKVGMEVKVKSVMANTKHPVQDSLKGTIQEVLSIDTSGLNQSVLVTTPSSTTFWLNHENIKKASSEVVE